MRDTERGRDMGGGGAEKQAPYKEPDVRLDPKTLGS